MAECGLYIQDIAIERFTQIAYCQIEKRYNYIRVFQEIKNGKLLKLLQILNENQDLQLCCEHLKFVEGR